MGLDWLVMDWRYCRYGIWCMVVEKWRLYGWLDGL